MILRKATLDDAKTLFKWRNDPETRAMSRDTSEVEWDTHLAWITARLSREDHGLYIAELDDTPVGTVRIDHGEISYTVAPDQRRMGLGERMLVAARERFGVKVAKIKRDNTASVKLAERAGHTVKFID